MNSALYRQRSKLKKTFALPNLENLLDLSAMYYDKVVIVSIVGKTPYNCYGLKVKVLGKKFCLDRSQKEECAIEGSYDEANRVIYLHLHSLLDTDTFIEHYSKIVEKCNEKNNCDDFLAVYNEIKNSFARAFFLLLHISHLIVVSHPTPTFDTNYIQYFKAVESLNQKIANKISDSLSSLEDLSPEWVLNGRFCTPRMLFYFERSPKGINNIKKVENNMEDRIYHILKKTRIISTAGGCLFAIPLNDDYVYMGDEESMDRLGGAVKGLMQDCLPGGCIQIQTPFSCEPDSDRSFQRFLQVHIQQARTKGFDDTVSTNRHHNRSHFELPTLKQWADVTNLLFGIIMRDKLISSLCTDTRFSEQRCLKVLPLAVARYQEGLAPHYPRAEHEARLAVALSLFRAQARGPMYHQYALELEAECRTHWENGRQQCEAASLTGNPCKLPKHSVNEQEHISGFIYKAVCDCGRKIGAREDPYTAKQANYIFYSQMSKECQCSKLERISFPVFEPSIKEFKAATLEPAPDDLLSVLSDRSTELTPDVERGLIRQPSTTEYLPGMLTLSSPPGLLPVYSSWSLVCLGASSLYSHNLGLSDTYHPGFLSSTNYLLPWDVTVYSKTKSNWAQVSKYSGRGRRGRPAGSLPQFTVKVFIGVEYECPAGHRFMLSSPDKMLKATPGSVVKDTGHKVAESDVPLYFPCACRNGKLAQLMRIHVVTPKAPVNCILDPKVQPAANAPIFVSTVDGPTKLTQSSYWIMRLPYVYVSDKEHYAQNMSGRLLQGVFGVTEVEP